MRPACSWSRLNEFRSFFLQLGISTSSARPWRIFPDIILVYTFESNHTLFELHKTSDDEQETLLDGTCEGECESGHRRIYAWRQKASEGSETNYDR